MKTRLQWNYIQFFFCWCLHLSFLMAALVVLENTTITWTITSTTRIRVSRYRVNCNLIRSLFAFKDQFPIYFHNVYVYDAYQYENAVPNILRVVAGKETEQKSAWEIMQELKETIRKCYTTDTYVMNCLYYRLLINNDKSFNYPWHHSITACTASSCPEGQYCNSERACAAGCDFNSACPLEHVCSFMSGYPGVCRGKQNI